MSDQHISGVRQVPGHLKVTSSILIHTISFSQILICLISMRRLVYLVNKLFLTFRQVNKSPDEEPARLDAKEVCIELTPFSSFSNSFPRNSFCSDRKSLKSVGAHSGLYGG